MSAKYVNYTPNFGGRLRVMCPECGAGGANSLGYQPKCHICEKTVMMQPASNDKVECTWEEFVQYMANKTV